MKLRLIIAVLPLALVACVPGLPSKSSSTDCADRVAHALSSPGAPVAGSYACLSAELQQAASRGVSASGDGALQAIAKSAPVYTSYEARGATRDGGVVYVLEGTGSPSQVLVIHVDRSGHVAGIANT